jgi:hypothetical protein
VKKKLELKKLTEINEPVIDVVELDSSRRYIIMADLGEHMPAAQTQKALQYLLVELNKLFGDDGVQRFLVTTKAAGAIYALDPGCDHDWRDKGKYRWCNTCGQKEDK